jgi:hypothetical protein
MDFSELHCALFSILAICADGLAIYFTKEGDPKKFGGAFRSATSRPPKQIQENNESKNTQYAYTNIISYFLLNANFFHGREICAVTFFNGLPGGPGKGNETGCP